MDDLKEMSNELSNIKRQNNQTAQQAGFTVPEGYFDEFPLKMQEKIRQDKQSPAFKLAHVFQKPVYAIAFATMLLLVISIPASMFILNRQQTNQQIAYHDIEWAELDYFDISEEMLIETLSADEALTAETTDEIDEEIMDYVLENVDYSTILDEL